MRPRKLIPRSRKARVALLLGLLLLFVLVHDGVSRPPQRLSVRGYILAVNGYRWARSIIYPKRICRFYPSCSHYSQEAVERYGLWKGGWMTADRLYRCRSNIPLDTPDPVPVLISQPPVHE